MLQVVRYAESQARARARIGRMPRRRQWRRVAEAIDVDDAIERMRSEGLAFWVADLPRSPDLLTIERHLQARSRQLVEELCRLLPREWTAFREWLRHMPDLVWLRAVMRARAGSEIGDLAGALGEFVRLPADRRAAAVAATPLRSYLDDTASPESLWLADFARHVRRLPSADRWALARIAGRIRNHLERVRELRESQTERRHPSGASTPAGAGAMWQLRDALARDLRDMLAGSPFNAGVAVIYGVLEVLQLEKVRALLIARHQGWAADAVLAESGEDRAINV